MEQKFGNIFDSFTEDNQNYVTEKFRCPEFPEQPGLDNEQIIAELLNMAPLYDDQKSATFKAEAFKFVCDNMLIDVNPQDFFPAFGCWDRENKPMWELLRKLSAKRWLDNLSYLDDRYYIGYYTGAWRMSVDSDHAAPDWEFAIAVGFPGIIERAEKYQALHKEQGTLTAEMDDFYQGVINAHKAILDTLERFRLFGLQRYPQNPRVLFVCDALNSLKQGPPKTFYEVLLFIYLHFMFGEYIDRFQERTLGNLDVLLWKYYQQDLQAKRLDEAKARTLLDYFLMQWGSIDSYWGQPFYLGGTDADGKTLYNPMSRMILEEFEKLQIPSPKIQLKVAENTPDEILDLALNMIRRSHSSLVFVGEPGIIRAMKQLGYTSEEARTFDVTGCYEYAVRGDENVTQSIYCNIPKAVELTLNNGIDPITKRPCGVTHDGLEKMQTFSDFYDAFLRQITWQIEEMIACNLLVEKTYSDFNPALLLSGTFATSMQKGLNAYTLGCKYNTTMLLACGLGSAVDSLMAVNELVYKQKLVTLPQLRDILRADWFHHEKLRQKMIHSKHRFGTGDPETDELACKLSKYLSDLVNRRPNARGGFYILSSHSARNFIELGKDTGATPDGRKAGTELSKNTSPHMITDTDGVTALISSVTKIDSLCFPGNYTLDLMLHPTGTTGSDGLLAMRTLLKVFFKHYGLALQFNVCSAEILRDAQAHPEKYPSLQVRVCGWNVRFNDMARSEQDVYIERCANM